MTDLKDWIEKLRDQKTATCPADYEERCELAHALSALEKEREVLARTNALLSEENVANQKYLPKVHARLDTAETELSALKALVGRMVEGLAKIARADVPPEKEGHYLAHREAVKIARSLLSEAKGEGER